MSANVKRNGQPGRPTWNYTREKDRREEGANFQDILEMTESVRNVLEDIQKSQMLECDIALAIKGMAGDIRAMLTEFKIFIAASAPKKSGGRRRRQR
jgi:hypothetical protein